MYNACSLALIGSESLASYLSCLTCIELANAKFYASHPLVDQQFRKGAFHSLGNTLAMCLSDAALSVLQKEFPDIGIITEAIDKADEYKYSSLMCMLSLSSVVNVPIESYYPIANEEDMNSLEVMFNCTILPRQILVEDANAKGPEGEKIHIFRCAMQPNDLTDPFEVANLPKDHYVALCKILYSNQSGQPSNFTPIFSLVQPFQNPSMSSGGNSSASTPTSTCKAPGKKLRQQGINTFLQKKIKLEDKSKPDDDIHSDPSAPCQNTGSGYDPKLSPSNFRFLKFCWKVCIPNP